MGRKYYYYSVILISSTTCIMFPVMISEIDLQMEIRMVLWHARGFEKPITYYSSSFHLNCGG